MTITPAALAAMEAEALRLLGLAATAAAQAPPATELQDFYDDVAAGIRQAEADLKAVAPDDPNIVATIAARAAQLWLPAETQKLTDPDILTAAKRSACIASGMQRALGFLGWSPKVTT